MRAVDLIIKKRDGGTLSAEELRFLMRGYVDGSVPDYQMSAWAMAVLWRGMDDRETADLTLAMAESGELLDLHAIAPLTVDKHSTGGVGDKTSLVLGPLCASLGLPVAKMSGRGLGFSGGTLDKLEAIPGMRIDLRPDEFAHLLRTVGLVIAGQGTELAPADKLLYALRDVTGTVPSLPLIAASIMSKKLAAGADCLVLDVKVGAGAFMKSLPEARALARQMVGIGQHAGRKVAAVITSMQQPLGYAIGNALEVKEAIATLQGNGPSDLVELCLALGAQLALLAGKASTTEDGYKLLTAVLNSGAAWRKFREFVAAQGGDLSTVDDPRLLPEATVVEPVAAPHDGFIGAIDADLLGLAVNALGGGRQRKDDRIDPSVGIVLVHKVGEFVAQGTPLATIHASHMDMFIQVHDRVQGAFHLQHSAPASLPLIYEVVEQASNVP
ncbi:MAG: thymidine phosphorylase [Herpetosiphonaceae bacterium]|nr:thymidine phosphorylase [Herpetosiphonaceae bacterium]